MSPTGDDGNAGDSGHPKKTIQAGVNAGALVGKDVHVAAGTYNQGAGGVSLATGVSVTGGFDSSTWLPGGGTTIVRGNPQAVLATGVTGVTLRSLRLEPSSSSGRAPARTASARPAGRTSPSSTS